MSVRRPMTLEAVDFDIVGEPASSSRKRLIPGRQAPLAKIESFYDDIESWSLIPPDDPQAKRESAHDRAQRSLYNEKLSLMLRFEQQKLDPSGGVLNDITTTPLGNGAPHANGDSLAPRTASTLETPCGLVNSRGVAAGTTADSQQQQQQQQQGGESTATDDGVPVLESPASPMSDDTETRPLLPLAAVTLTTSAPKSATQGNQLPVRGKPTTDGGPKNAISAGPSGAPGATSATAPRGLQSEPKQQQAPPVNEKTRARSAKLQQDLMDAVNNRKPSKIKKLLKSRAALASTVSAKVKPFHAAIRLGNVDNVRAFVEGDPNLEKQPDPDDGSVALLVAVAAGRVAVVQWLVDSGGARLDVRNATTDDGIWELASRLPPETVDDRGASGRVMATTLVGLFKKHRKDYKTTPIHEASAAGKLDVIEFVIGAGFDAWTDDQTGYSFIHVAAFNNRVDVILKYLKQQYRDVEESISPLPSSSLITSDVVLSTGVERKNKSTGKTPLHVAANRGHVDSVAALLTCGARPSTVDADGWTALHDAAAGRSDDASPAVVRMLARHSSETIRSKNDDGETPLHVAARHGRLGAVRTLVKIDPAPLTTADCDGWTPLHGAASCQRPDVVRAILDAAAGAFGQDGVRRLKAAADRTGKTPRELVASGRETAAELMELLVISG